MNAVTAMSIDRYYNELRAALRKEKLYKKINKENNLLIISFKTESSKNEAKKIICTVLDSNQYSSSYCFRHANEPEPLGGALH